MTAFGTAPDVARARDLDCAREAYRTFSILDRPGFGTFAINFLRSRGLELVPASEPEPLECGETPFPSDVVAALFPQLLDSPFTRQALSMSVETLADLLAALAERDLRWVPGENGECGTLVEGQPEPPDLHVVFDAFRNAWQRDDDRARDLGDPCIRWFTASDGVSEPWASLQRIHGPMTPDGGIAPTTPGPAGVRGDDGCAGGIR